MSASGSTVIYVSGEESLRQLSRRARRLGLGQADLQILGETDVSKVEATLLAEEPNVAVIDSVQTLFDPEFPSAPGSVGQVRECTARLQRLAKQQEMVLFLVGHVTKTGDLAGPRVLEHVVDTVLYFEGERNHAYRVLRATKNRFGSTNEIGVFEMTDSGLLDVSNPSRALLAQRPLGAPGSVVTMALEGTRPLLVEVQALVAPSAFGLPRRTASGIDHNRFALLLAVLERRVGLVLGNQDAYVKVAGGLRLDEPAADLALVLAVASSYRGRAIEPGTAVAGEVGLTGEVRLVNGLDLRIREAAKLGFAKCLVPATGLERLGVTGVELAGVSTVEEALAAMGL
jgi:DNA repair protein RadA/Sms